ncbi:hypothetical protein VNO78_24041 [Psophocarpus tetragonolobus]|uniref:Uncharacterized protein n=1 Tax=Psophocarpus tetragonolobus TaxID=3891 RepID=A0AAN9XED0_PSOTE
MVPWPSSATRAQRTSTFLNHTLTLPREAISRKSRRLQVLLFSSVASHVARHRTFAPFVAHSHHLFFSSSSPPPSQLRPSIVFPLCASSVLGICERQSSTFQLRWTWISSEMVIMPRWALGAEGRLGLRSQHKVKAGGIDLIRILYELTLSYPTRCSSSSRQTRSDQICKVELSNSCDNQSGFWIDTFTDSNTWCVFCAGDGRILMEGQGMDYCKS